MAQELCQLYTPKEDRAVCEQVPAALSGITNVPATSALLWAAPQTVVQLLYWRISAVRDIINKLS